VGFTAVFLPLRKRLFAADIPTMRITTLVYGLVVVVVEVAWIGGLIYGVVRVAHL
jgi:hypothetical protein